MLTGLDGQKAVRSDQKPSQIPVNLYENVCAKLPVQGDYIPDLVPHLVLILIVYSVALAQLFD